VSPCRMPTCGFCALARHCWHSPAWATSVMSQG
jgi:hypothetical protein